MKTSVQYPFQKCPPKWLPLPYMINSVAISDDASRVVAGTYYFNYTNTTEKETHGAFGIYCVDWASGKRLWADEYLGCQGVYAVAISGDGSTAAAGGKLTDRADGADQPLKHQGLLRAYCAHCGKTLLDYPGILSPPAGNGYAQVVKLVSLSADGKVLAAAADKVYVFVREGEKFPKQPSLVIGDPRTFSEESGCLPTAVAVHPSGKWLAACDMGGNVCLVEIAGGKLKPPVFWPAPKVPIDRLDPNSQQAPLEFISLATAGTADAFVAGGNDYVYYFTLQQMRQGQGPVASHDTWVAPPPPPAPPPAPPPPAAPAAAPSAAKKSAPDNIRWVAISGDGSLVTTVVNRKRDEGDIGSLRALRYADGALSVAWEKPLSHYPDATCIDAAGKYVVACDGWPFGTPGAFYCFEADGTLRWKFDTENMNWPIVISANGKGIAGGGDDGILYCFTP